MHRALREQQIHALVMEALIRPIDEIIANWERHLAGTALMRGFIAARPELWNEDIGESASPELPDTP